MLRSGRNRQQYVRVQSAIKTASKIWRYLAASDSIFSAIGSNNSGRLLRPLPRCIAGCDGVDNQMQQLHSPCDWIGGHLVEPYEQKAGRRGLEPATSAVTAEIRSADAAQSTAALACWHQLKSMMPVGFYCRSGLKNARISAARRSGCSAAAKCPPFGISVQRCTL